MKCPECHFENPEGIKFCGECGAKLERICPACNFPNPLRFKFCGECGEDLRKPAETPPIDYSQPQSYTPKYLADKILTTRSSIEGERKLVSVLFADVANYTSISEKLDPEEVHQIMDGCFKILMDEIHRYEGTINQFTGDGVMALFGAPVAHEDHAQRACHASLSIQKAIGDYGQRIKNDYDVEFKLRIGLNSGAVIVGSIGDDLRMDYTAVGDTSNLASRMQDIANPGSVLVSGNTHKLTRAYFEFESLGQVPIKGKEETQEAYELIRASEIETRIEAAAVKGLTRFVGRKQELEALRLAFEKARSGSGQVLGIVGEAGVGKSRLILEFKNTIPQAEYSYLEGRCLHYGGSMPYLPILDVLKGYFQIEEGDREVAVKKKLRDKLQELEKEIQAAPPALHEVLSLKVEDDKYLQLGPQQRRERTFEAIRDLLIRESQRKPLVLAIEDLHWIDKTSQEFLNYLIEWLPNTRILLILLYRPEYTHQWGSKSYYGKIGLDQLSIKTSAELVQTILEGGKVAPEIGGLILGRAGGNPLFVEELTHSLVENGSIQKKDHQFVLTRKPSEIEVPDTIQGIIAARMDRVEENLKRIMQVASVIGREFAYRVLATITGMKEDLKASLLNLQGLEFIYEKQLFPELEYIFKHALTQEVAYNSLLLKRRKEIHERIGGAIEALYSERLEEHYELLAYHYVRSEDKVKGVKYLDLANRKAAKANALEEAKAYFDQAMELLDTLPDTKENQERRIFLVSNQQNVFMLLLKASEYHEILTRYRTPAINLENPRLQGSFCARLAFCDLGLGSFDKAMQTFARATELCEAGGNVEDAGFSYSWLAWCHHYKGDFDRALSLKEQVLGKIRERFNLVVYVRMLCCASATYACLGRLDEALKEAREAMKVAKKYSDNSLISFSALQFVNTYVWKRDLEKAVEYAELAVMRAPTPADKLWARSYLAWVWCLAGDPNKGVNILAKSVEIFRTGPYVPMALPAMARLIDAYLLARNYDEARQTAEELLDLAKRCGARLYLAFGRYFLGEIALQTHPNEAGMHFEQSISMYQRLKAEVFLGHAYSGMGHFHKQQGNTEQARAFLTKALEIFERLGTLIEPDKMRKELAELGD